MSYTTWSCRFFYMLYLSLAYGWMFKPKELLAKHLHAIQPLYLGAGDITPAHNAALGWIGVGFLAASFMFMAVSQLKFSSQKKVLQYHSLAVLAQGYMSGRDTAAGLLDADAPGPYWAFAAVLFLISIVPCYVGVTDKDKVE